MSKENLDEQIKAYEDFHLSYGRNVAGHRKAIKAFNAFLANPQKPKAVEGASKKVEAPAKDSEEPEGDKKKDDKKKGDGGE